MPLRLFAHLVARVPRVDVPKRVPVLPEVRLRVDDDLRVDLGVEALLSRVPELVLVLALIAPLQLRQHLLEPPLHVDARHDAAGAVAHTALSHRPAVRGRVLVIRPEHGIGVGRLPCKLRIHRPQVGHHLVHRVVEGVEVHPIEAHRQARANAELLALRVVVRAEPLDEPCGRLVPPHPVREPSPKVRERLLRALVPERAAGDVPVHTLGVRPVALDDDSLEAVPLDQHPRQHGAHVVELLRAVRALPEEHEARLTPHRSDQRGRLRLDKPLDAARAQLQRQRARGNLQRRW